MTLEKFTLSIALFLLPSGFAVFGQVGNPDPAPATSASPIVEEGIDWYNPVSWGIEGRGWSEGLACDYDRLPAWAGKNRAGRRVELQSGQFRDECALCHGLPADLSPLHAFVATIIPWLCGFLQGDTKHSELKS